ncbi:hypothetical protein Y032_0409g940 [Ancylostoma ceylanicum]|uniref:Reverse transcriptase domain-containing protein n=1 Tax=Ancylostoma ceylanicum TaxID=53326 RepID=A0A016X2M8_9BILA|nr:hypothetical protein Y032_0409g940 [Ancylostoma ceylanicum]
MCKKNLLNPPIPSAILTLGPVPPIQKEEVVSALAKTRNGRAPGPDNLPSKIWRGVGGKGKRWLTSSFNGIIAERKLPEA